MILKNFFKKNKKQPKDDAESSDLPICSHTWKDFPWYVTYQFDPPSYTSIVQRGKLEIRVIEPYVCAHCHKRMDISLTKIEVTNVNKNEIEKFIKETTSQYKGKIRPMAIVEDMIQDFIYVDREKLDILEKLRGQEKHESD